MKQDFNNKVMKDNQMKQDFKVHQILREMAVFSQTEQNQFISSFILGDLNNRVKDEIQTDQDCEKMPEMVVLRDNDMIEVKL